jgi:Rps23 Pro-64 3,4-dihydroxylase Tpa1-like proline 4-hydroxylase
MLEIVNAGQVSGRLRQLQEQFCDSYPFNHIVIDDFFKADVADGLAAEIDVAKPNWHEYHNAIEIKQTCNNWNDFPPLTYRVFSFLVSDAFVSMLRDITGCINLVADVGLHGGGWHRHRRGGKLNAHLDYSIHPKTRMQRKLNLIAYLSRDWDRTWGGGLGLWAHDAEGQRPSDMVKVIDCSFNRAVLFDTTQNSWHGLPDPIACPKDKYRSSLAVYYMMPAPEGAPPRERALFSPHKGQENDLAVLELIRKRSSSSTAASVYRIE